MGLYKTQRLVRSVESRFLAEAGQYNGWLFPAQHERVTWPGLAGSMRLKILDWRRPVSNSRVFIQTMITLASASLGLVAALAWNEAIKATIKVVFQADDSLAGLYTYAVLATVIAVAVLIGLAWLATRVGGEAVITGEAEG